MVGILSYLYIVFWFLSVDAFVNSIYLYTLQTRWMQPLHELAEAFQSSSICLLHCRGFFSWDVFDAKQEGRLKGVNKEPHYWRINDYYDKFEKQWVTRAAKRASRGWLIWNIGKYIFKFVSGETRHVTGRHGIQKGLMFYSPCIPFFTVIDVEQHGTHAAWRHNRKKAMYHISPVLLPDTSLKCWMYWWTMEKSVHVGEKNKTYTHVEKCMSGHIFRTLQGI